MSRLAPVVALIGSCLACAAVAACTKVVETSTLTETALGYGPTCHSALGGYYLPRKLLTIAVEANAGQPRPTIKVTDTKDLATVTVADATQTFCLDYLAAWNSKDIVTVDRSPQGLLASIHSNVEDRTPAIVNSLIDIASDLAIAAGRGALTDQVQPGDKLDLQFDPFDWDDLMLAKTALRRFGFCIYVEGKSFPIHGLDPLAIRAAAERWCSTPNPPRPARFVDELATLPVPPEAMRSGVLYRPNIAYRVVTLRKRDPYGPGAWTLYQSKRVEMPNASPVLAIGIERAMFTTRKTTVRFNDGVLTDVWVDKGSELEGFVSIPLKLAKAIVDIPAQIIQIRITDVQNQAAVINAQGQLINALRDYNALVARDAGVPGRSAAGRSSELFGRCRDAGGDFDDCSAIARSGR